MNGHSTSNGDRGFAPAADIDAQILRALELVYDPRTSKEHRDNASQYLEQIKSQPDAPAHGYTLAANKSHPVIVRYYGLSLLEHAIRLRWSEYSGEQSTALREWILKLAHSVSKEDQAFVRNKIAQLWVDVAKRSWVLDWMDMDELLVQLWGGSVVHKELVLEILETLSENSFGKEDATTAMRGNDLSKACVEIFTPAQLMVEHFPKRDTNINVRFGEEGWLARISELLSWCFTGGMHEAELQTCVVKALSTLKSVVGWVLLKAIATTFCIQRICECLTISSNPALQLVAVESLYALYNRTIFSHKDVQDIVWPMFDKESINILRRLYEGCVVDADSIDDQKYLLCKKFSEMIHNLGRFLDEKPDGIPPNGDIPNFLDLLLTMVANESLHVSIPILHLWNQILVSDVVGDLPSVLSLIGRLLEICSSRLLRYNSLPPDSGVPAMTFLKEDIDTLPERHAFLGNYRRYCKDVIHFIVQKQPYDALNHILSQTDQLIAELYHLERPLEAHSYTKAEIPALKLDAQFSVIEAALMGYCRWRADARTAADEAVASTIASINSNLEQWCIQFMERSFVDPYIQQLMVNLTVEFVDTTLKKQGPFVIRVFNFILDAMFRLSAIKEQGNAQVYNEAVKETRRMFSYQLQRLALRGANHLVSVYDDIVTRLTEYCQMPAVHGADKDRCSSVLFVIIQRADSIDVKEREARLEVFVQPVIERWQSPQLAESLSTFGGFCDMLGLSNLQSYLVSRRVNTIEDWAQFPLDEEGKTLNAAIEAAQNNVPLRVTKTFLGISVEKNEPGSPASQVAVALWTKYLPIMLPRLLQLISLAHSFSDPRSWGELPLQLRDIPSRVLRDRYWQVGITTGSREDFYSSIEESKSTMEGLASTIRGSLRMVREASYRLLYSMSLLDDAIYKYEELPVPLAKAFFTDASALTIHQTSVILTGLPSLIYSCPAECRPHFIPPILTAMFEFLDQKVSTEWERLDRARTNAGPDDDLVEEMKDEAILRQLTQTCITMVVRLLDPDLFHSETLKSLKPPTSSTTPPPAPAQSLRDFILSTPPVLKSVILFSTHALRMHDSRACGSLTRTLRTLIPSFTSSTDPLAADVRDFISTSVLQATIESLHDPYFVDIQVDLAGLIASILVSYKDLTGTPRAILESLPGVTSEGVGEALRKLGEVGEGRGQRGVVLKLLEGVRGVAVADMGRLPREKRRSRLEERYLKEGGKGKEGRSGSVELGGVADMFG